MRTYVDVDKERPRPDVAQRRGVGRPPAGLPVTPAHALALQRAIGNAALTRVVQRTPQIEFPKHNQKIVPPHYAVRTRPDPDTDNVRVRIDPTSPQFEQGHETGEQAHESGGHWWFDWSGFALGKHKIRAEAWNPAGARTLTDAVQVEVVDHAPVDPGSVQVGAPARGDRLEVLLTYTVAGAVRTARLHVSHVRHAVSQYFDDPDGVYQPALTTLVDTDLPGFAAAFSEYAQRVAQALATRGLPLAPSNPELEIVTPSGVAFHSDTPAFEGQIHCFPTNTGGGIARTFGPDDYAKFKDLARLCAYVFEAPAGTVTQTAISKAIKSMPFLDANPWLLARIRARYPHVGTYNDVVKTACAALEVDDAVKAAAAKKAGLAKAAALGVSTTKK